MGVELWLSKTNQNAMMTLIAPGIRAGLANIIPKCLKCVSGVKMQVADAFFI